MKTNTLLCHHKHLEPKIHTYSDKCQNTSLQKFHLDHVTQVLIGTKVHLMSHTSLSTNEVVTAAMMEHDHAVLFLSGAGNGRKPSFVLHSLVSFCASSRSSISL